MKAKLIIMSFALLIVFGSVFNHVNAQDKNNVLKDSKQRLEIFKSIANNQQYMTEFMNEMKENQPGLDMMVGDIMNISKKDNDVGVRIGNMMMNDPQYMNLIMSQMINRANNDESTGKNMFSMIKTHDHLYGMMEGMMNGNNMGSNHMGHNVTHSSSHGNMMNHGRGMSNGSSSSMAHGAERLSR